MDEKEREGRRYENNASTARSQIHFIVDNTIRFYNRYGGGIELETSFNTGKRNITKLRTSWQII